MMSVPSRWWLLELYERWRCVAVVLMRLEGPSIFSSAAKVIDDVGKHLTSLDPAIGTPTNGPFLPYPLLIRLLLVTSLPTQSAPSLRQRT